MYKIFYYVIMHIMNIPSSSDRRIQAPGLPLTTNMMGRDSAISSHRRAVQNGAKRLQLPVFQNEINVYTWREMHLSEYTGESILNGGVAEEVINALSPELVEEIARKMLCFLRETTERDILMPSERNQSLQAFLLVLGSSASELVDELLGEYKQNSGEDTTQ